LTPSSASTTERSAFFQSMLSAETDFGKVLKKECEQQKKRGANKEQHDSKQN